MHVYMAKTSSFCHIDIFLFIWSYNNIRSSVCKTLLSRAIRHVYFLIYKCINPCQNLFSFTLVSHWYNFTNNNGEVSMLHQLMWKQNIRLLQAKRTVYAQGFHSLDQFDKKNNSRLTYSWGPLLLLKYWEISSRMLDEKHIACSFICSDYLKCQT